MTKVVLDISRLISRVRHTTPSGVDRVEMAYARGLAHHLRSDLSFAAVHPAGIYGKISASNACAYLDELERRWDQSDAHRGPLSLAKAAPWMQRLLPRSAGIAGSEVMVQVSPHHWHRPARVRAKLEREKARFVCMVHDLIPIEYPEYARPGGAALHEVRMRSVADNADAVIVNSTATKSSLTRWLEGRGLEPPPIHVALLGTQSVVEAPPFRTEDQRPYFLCLGTIEPRKNHLLLLHLWREMAASLPSEEIPRLIIVGRRGWENEQVLDLLDRCPAIQPFITEVNSCGDRELAALLRGARALLMPSFSEGFGMPVAEALSVGTAVIASDIGAHREVGGDAPEYCGTLDGEAWRAAILDFTQEGSGYQAQKKRIASWQKPTWAAHIEQAMEVIEAQCERAVTTN